MSYFSIASDETCKNQDPTQTHDSTGEQDPSLDSCVGQTAQTALSSLKKMSEESIVSQENESKSLNSPLSEATNLKVQALELELADLKLRHAAELANMRTRSHNQIAAAKKFSLESLLKEMLPVVDSLKKAAAMFFTLPSDGALDQKAHQSALQSGIEATLKMLEDLLKAQGVSRIDQLNVPFQPQYHHAMSTTHSDQYPNHTIVQIYQEGYLLHERLLRPAMVQVNILSDPS